MNKIEPCPFESGLRKFALDPDVVILCEMKKNIISKKIASMGSKHQLNPTLVFFLKWIFFQFQKNYKCISKKFTTTGSGQG